MRETWLDEIDLRVLGQLQRHSTITNDRLSEVAHLSPPQCHRRVKKLTKAGVIKKTVALLDRHKMGFDLMALVSIVRDKKNHAGMREFENAISRFPQIVECYALTGEFDYMLKVVAPDLETFSSFLRDDLLRLPGISAARTSICLQEIKSSTELPIRP